MKFKIGDIVKLKDESVHYSFEKDSLYFIHSINEEKNEIIAYITKCNGEEPRKLYIHVRSAALIKVCNKEDYKPILQSNFQLLDL